MKKKSIGLVLSGGGARGLAHAGALKAFDELGIPVSIISGTSSGAMVGVLYAAGVKPDQMVDIMKKTKLFNIGGLSFNMKGLLKTSSFKKIIVDNLKVKNFEELSIPVSVCLTDFTNALTVHVDKGPLFDPLIASCSIPLIFTPTIMNGSVMVDGGLLNNFPVEPLIGNCDSAIRAPTLILHAVDDALQIYRNAEFAATHIPGAELVRFERGGHFLIVVEQDTVRRLTARHILASLERVPSGGP